jgi:anti-anti-sigma factor
MGVHSSYIENKRLYSIIIDQEFDYSTYKDFKAAYEQLPIEAKYLELNLQNTSHIDSSALGMMLLMNQSVHKQIAKIDVINTNPSVLKVFQISHFNKIFNIVAA